MKSNKQLIESLDKHINELAVPAGVANFGKNVAAKSGELGKKIMNKTAGFRNDMKAVGQNTLSGAKTVGKAAAAHPIVTAAGAGALGGAALARRNRNR